MRRKMRKSSSRALFRKTAGLTRAINLGLDLPRGGRRL